MNLQPNLDRWCGHRFVSIEHRSGMRRQNEGFLPKLLGCHGGSLDLEYVSWCAGLGLVRGG